MARVGVIDSGGPAEDLAQARAFLPDGTSCPAWPDRLGHGAVVAEIIRRGCPEAAILHGQVFDDQPLTSALRISAALRWFAQRPRAERVDMVCLSLGLAADRTPLRAACAFTRKAGILIVAAHPARGAPCYPAAYPEVIAGTGDARCAWDETSRLGPALFGAWCDSPERRAQGLGGASLGAARLAGHLAQEIRTNGRPADFAEAVERLAARVSHHGPERRRAPDSAS